MLENWKQGYESGKAAHRRSIRERHMKRAQRKYPRGPLLTTCTEPELPALTEGGWSIIDTRNVAVNSVRYTLQHAR